MAEQGIKVIHEVEYAGRRSCRFSKVIELNGKRFKITHDTGNCYSYTQIFVMLPTAAWERVADEDDIGDCYINYVADESFKEMKMAHIYDKAVEYIKNVFC